jgi:hypothetical protein
VNADCSAGKDSGAAARAPYAREAGSAAFGVAYPEFPLCPQIRGLGRLWHARQSDNCTRLPS